MFLTPCTRILVTLGLYKLEGVVVSIRSYLNPSRGEQARQIGSKRIALGGGSCKKQDLLTFRQNFSQRLQAATEGLAARVSEDIVAKPDRGWKVSVGKW